MTQSEQDYLKVIYGLGGAYKLVTNKEISTALEISPPSVSEMIKKLVVIGQLEYVPYKGSKLTELGIKMATQMIRRHRLWEVFLLKHLGYRWEQVHVEAEKLEHAMSDLFEERFYEYLGGPKYCPHGSPIPNLEGTIVEATLMRLSEVKVGDKIIIQKVADKIELLQYLNDIGLMVKGHYKVTYIEPFMGPISIEYKETKLVIGREATKNIFITKEET